MTAQSTVFLFGQKYTDYIYDIGSELKLGTRNHAQAFRTQLGGIYNIKRFGIANTNYVCKTFGETDAVIIQEISQSRRTSITRYTNEEDLTLEVTPCHWAHIAYIDDTAALPNIDGFNVPVTYDFCTANDRTLYEDLINKSEFIFDSRENKHLYSKLDTDKRIVLHDPYGSEVLCKGKVSHKQEITPIKKIAVNGAGDLFAAIFIHLCMEEDFETAADYTTHLTKDFMLRNL